MELSCPIVGDVAFGSGFDWRRPTGDGLGGGGCAAADCFGLYCATTIMRWPASFDVVVGGGDDDDGGGCASCLADRTSDAGPPSPVGHRR